MNYDESFIHKYYAPFSMAKNHEDVSSVSEYDSAKQIAFHQKKSKIFLWQVSLFIFFLKYNKLSSHMGYISGNIHS